MIRKTLALASIAVVCALSGTANAQITGTYVGASIGQSRYSDACPRLPAAGCNDSDLGFKFFSGLQFGRVLGAELAMVDLGNIAGAGGAGYSALGLEVVGLAQWPITNAFSVFGKAGGYRLNTSARGAVGGSDKSTDWTYGLGLKMAINRNFGTRVEWQRYKDVGDSTTGQTDISFVGASLMYQF